MLTNRNTNVVFMLALFSVIVSDIFRDVPWYVYVSILGIYAAIHVYGSIKLSARFFVPVFDRGSVSSNAIALTFDDGPIEGKTDRLLDILKSKHVSAAFFCIGNRIESHPELASRIHQDGHLIGNHSFWHGKTFDLQLSSSIAKELIDTDAAIRKSTGLTPLFFRPPYGVTNPMVAEAVALTGHKVVGWTIRSFDTVISDRVKLLNRVSSAIRSGDVVLFHDFSDAMLDILPEFIDHVRKLGFKIERIDKLLNEAPYA